MTARGSRGDPFGLRASATWLYIGRTAISRTTEGLVERGAFARLDVHIAQSLPRGLELGVGLDNLADTRPDQWPVFPGRQLYVSLGWRGQRADR